jgi:hypothetical protein
MNLQASSRAPTARLRHVAAAAAAAGLCASMAENELLQLEEENVRLQAALQALRQNNAKQPDVGSDIISKGVQARLAIVTADKQQLIMQVNALQSENAELLRILPLVDSCSGDARVEVGLRFSSLRRCMNSSVRECVCACVCVYICLCACVWVCAMCLCGFRCKTRLVAWIASLPSCEASTSRCHGRWPPRRMRSRCWSSGSATTMPSYRPFVTK